MTIRTLTIDDYDALYALWMSSPNMGFNNLDDSREGIDKYLKRNPTTSFAAIIDGELAGAILAGHDGRRGFVHHTCVAARFQGRGVGSALVEKCMDALKAEGINKVALLVFKYNDAGNAFWEKQGFSVRGDLNYRNRALAELIRIDT